MNFTPLFSFGRSTHPACVFFENVFLERMMEADEDRDLHTANQSHLH
jgi:hypothetical protein